MLLRDIIKKVRMLLHDIIEKWGKVFYTDISVPVGPVYHMVHKSGVNVPSGT